MTMFLAQLERLEAGNLGVIAETDIEPLSDLPNADELPAPEPDDVAALLEGTVILKLNGGLGTSMGLATPKSLLPVKNGPDLP